MAEYMEVDQEKNKLVDELKVFLEKLLTSFLGNAHTLDSLIYKKTNERPFQDPLMILYNTTAALDGLSGKLDKLARHSSLQSAGMFGRQGTQHILNQEMSISDMIELCGSLTRAWTRQQVETVDGFENALCHVLGRHMPVVSGLTNKAYQAKLEQTYGVLRDKLQTADDVITDADVMEVNTGMDYSF